MKQLLFPLLASLALPTAVNAESYWLVLTLGDGGHKGASALEKIDQEIAEFCLKATDYAGCIKTMSKGTDNKKSSNKRFIYSTGVSE